MPLVIFIVNGEDVLVKRDFAAPLKEARDDALRESHNTFHPGERWEIRNEKGELIDPDVFYPAKQGEKFFLSLKVAAGGTSVVEEQL